MSGFPISETRLDAAARELRIDLSRASIRDMGRLVHLLEEQEGVRFIRLEFGIPGLPAQPAGVAAQMAALEREGVANTYAPQYGVPRLKEAGSRFLRAFLDLDIPPECVVPTVGAMQGCFAGLVVATRLTAGRERVLFIEPGFASNKNQARFLGLPTASVDLYDREGLLENVEAVFRQGDVGCLLWSSPNNPAWVILREEEVRALGELCDRYGVAAIEDQAYVGMDFRTDYGVPRQPPYPPTIGRYCERSFLVFSGSKIFSYAGERVGFTAIPPGFARLESDRLQASCGAPAVLDAFVKGPVYCVIASVGHSAQHALAALLEQACDGSLQFLEVVRAYRDRARHLRRVTLAHGFELVYDRDGAESLAEGFYFTLRYPGMSGRELQRALIRYGVSCTTLEVFGSTRTEGVRVCVSLTAPEDFPVFEERIARFARDHPVSQGGG